MLGELVKAVLERALELTAHLGYARHDPSGHNSGNSRNGTISKRVQTGIGPVPIEVPRDRAGMFEPLLVPKRSGRISGGLDDMIISRLSAFLQFRHGFTVGPMRTASSPDLWGLRRDQPGGSPRCSAHRAVPVRKPSAGVADGRPGQVPHFRDLLSWHTSEVTAGCLGEGCSSHSWPPLPKPAVAQIGPAAVSEVSARQPVTNQVTAHPGLVAARVFMAVGGIASTCVHRARPLGGVCRWCWGQAGRGAGLGL
jgi:hypothetical protein